MLQIAHQPYDCLIGTSLSMPHTSGAALLCWYHTVCTCLLSVCNGNYITPLHNAHYALHHSVLPQGRRPLGGGGRGGPLPVNCYNSESCRMATDREMLRMLSSLSCISDGDYVYRTSALTARDSEPLVKLCQREYCGTQKREHCNSDVYLVCVWVFLDIHLLLRHIESAFSCCTH